MLRPGQDAGDDAGNEQRTRTPQLARELSDFLVELSIAMHKHAIYPPGHPLLAQAVDGVYRTLLALLAGRPVLSIGVARRQLIIEGVATESIHPLLSELAGKLHRHHLGALKFVRGVSRAELSEALATVGIEPLRDELPLGLQPALSELPWANVKLFPLTYDRLELLDEEELDGDGARHAGMRDGRAAQLWVGLARAALAGDRPEAGDDTEEGEALEPAVVAQAIDDHGREQAYDQVIVGYLLQIADEVRHSGQTEGTGLKRRISKLVSALKPETLGHLLEMGGDNEQRRRFVLDAAQGMSVDAVVELVKAAAQAEGQLISRSLIRMLTKLAKHAAEPDSRGHVAEGALREHVTRLVGGWSLEDPNPVAYSAALDEISRRRSAPAVEGDEARFQCEPERVVEIAVALDVTGGAVKRAVTAMLKGGALRELLDLVDRAPGSVTAVPGIWETILQAEALRELLAAPRENARLVHRLLQRAGVRAVPALLDALTSAPDPTHREPLIGLLAGFGPAAASAVAQRLAGTNTVLARELLALLARLAPAVPPPESRAFLSHADPLVRREAIRLFMAHEGSRDATMLAAVRDPDMRLVSVGLLEAQEGCSPRIAAAIRQRVDDAAIDNDILRAGAVRAVCAGVVTGRSADETLEWLLPRALRPGRMLRRARLRPLSAELLAVLAALAGRWDSDPRARRVLQLARMDDNAAIRGAAAQARTTPVPARLAAR
jgi:hypothetical protein